MGTTQSYLKRIKVFCSNNSFKNIYQIIAFLTFIAADQFGENDDVHSAIWLIIIEKIIKFEFAYKQEIGLEFNIKFAAI